MAASSSVQFRGIKAVLKAYENAGIAPFAIRCNQQLIMKFENSDMEGGKAFLHQALNELSTGGGLATYTLCVYDELKAGEKINSKTPFDMSFNFKTEDDYEEARGRRYGTRDYEERIAGLEKELKELRDGEEQDDDAESVGSIWGTFNKLLDNPQIAAAISGKVISIIDGFRMPRPGAAPIVPVVVHSAKIAGVETPEAHTADQLEKIRRAVDILARVDPMLGDHLLAISAIADKDPAKYNFLIGML